MKKTFRKAISVLLIAVMMSGTASLAGFVGSELNLSGIRAEATTNDYYTYTVSGESASIVGVDTAISGDVVIPSALGGYPVTIIDMNAFVDCTAITSITIPDSVTYIGDFAFANCTSLKDITLGNSVKTIGDAAFSGCTSLTNITLPSSVTNIGYFVFLGCQSLESITVDTANMIYSSDEYGVLFNKDKSVLIQYPSGNAGTSYTIPDSTKFINEYSFYFSNNLVSVVIPDSVTKTGLCSFAYCNKLSSVTVGKGLKFIEENAFVGCTELTDITLPDGITMISSDAFCDTGLYNDASNWENNVLYIGNYLIDSESSLSGSYSVKEGTKLIADEALDNCYNLTDVTIPDSVIYIGNNAFYNSYNITSIKIGSGVKKIGENAFRACRSLGSITVDPSNTVYSSDDCGVLFNKDKSVLIRYPAGNTVTSYTIPDGVKVIAEYAFQNCENLTSVYFADSITEISSDAFSGCKNLTDVTLSDNLKVIGRSAFSFCPKITSIIIPDGVTRINDGAFNYCTDLTNISVPDSVEYIGDDAFNLTGYYRDASNWENNVLYVGNHLTDTKKSLSGTYSIKEGTKTIAAVSFNNCDELTNVIFPDSLTTIPEKAFYDCDGLTNITIPDGVTHIGYSAFAFCDNLASVTLPDSITDIDSYAFEPTELYDNEENWENDALYVGNYLIRAKESISGSYSIKEGTKVIADSAFSNCQKITSISIPADMTNIGTDAFIYCKSLRDITVDPSNKAFSIDEYGVLFDIDKTVLIQYPLGNPLLSYEVPDSVKTIEYGAFYRCNSIVNYIIPDSVKNIGELAFSTLGSFTDVYFTGTEEEWNSISIGADNEELTIATIHFNYSPCKHSIDEITTIPATCTSNGEKILKCALCSEIFGTEEIPSTGHDESEWKTVVEPTTKTEGKKIKECTVCKVTLKEEVVEKLPPKVLIKDDDVIVTPSITTIKYGNSIILHINESKIPDGGYVEWTASNGCFDMEVSEDGLTCKISSNKSGDTTFTATIYDSEGDPILYDEQVMTSNACCFYKILAFFKNMFSLAEIISAIFNAMGC